MQEREAYPIGDNDRFAFAVPRAVRHQKNLENEVKAGLQRGTALTESPYQHPSEALREPPGRNPTARQQLPAQVEKIVVAERTAILERRDALRLTTRAGQRPRTRKYRRGQPRFSRNRR